MYRRILAVMLVCLLLIAMLPASAATKPHRHEMYDNGQRQYPTCTQPGVLIGKCGICGAVMWKDEFAPALGHDFTWTVVPPTCTEQGTRTGVCDRCGYTWVGYEDALGHDWGEWVVVEEATYEHEGCRERVCKRCGLTEREYFAIEGGALPIIVTKQLIRDDEGGEPMYTPNEPVYIEVNVKNTTDRDIRLTDVRDYFLGYDYNITIDSSRPVIKPHSEISYTSFFKAEEVDPKLAYGEILDYVSAYWCYTDDSADGVATSNTVSVEIYTIAPIVIEKKNIDVEGTVYKAGDKAAFRVDITNLEEETIHNVHFYDYIQDTGDLIYLESSVTDVEPGSSAFLFDYIVQPEDVERGFVTDTIFAWIGEGNNQVVSNNVTIYCEGEPVRLLFDKSIDNPPAKGYYTEGEEIIYTFYFTNDSAVNFVDVEIEDDYIHGKTSIGPVAAYSSANASMSYIVSALDCELGSKFNVATATARDENGNEYQLTSNPLSVPCQFEIMDAPAMPSIAVKKQVISIPMFGERYVPGETVRYFVTVTNTGDVPVYDLHAYDDIYTYYGPIELTDSYAGPIDPGCSYVFIFENEMEYIDCECGEVWDYAFVTYKADNDMDGVEYSNSCVVYGQTEAPGAEEGALLLKYELSTPKLDYYVEGETVSFMVVFYNRTGETLSNLRIYDILSDAPGGLIWEQYTVNPYEAIMVTVDYVVTAIDVNVFGQVSNIAWASASTRSNGDVSYTSNEVIVPCGKPYTPAPSHGSSCIKTLVASNNGAELVRTDLCDAHHKLELRTKDMDAASAAAVWERNVYAMYSVLINATGSEAFATDRDMFFTEMKMLKGLAGEENVGLIAEIMRERATELCYELSGLERMDDLLKPKAQYPLSVPTVNNCVYDVRSYGNAWYQTTTYTSAGHLMTQNAVDKLLEAAKGDAAYASQLLEKVHEMWLSALNGEYNVIFRDNPVYSADLAMFVNSINARKAALEVIYPNDAELVNGLITRELKNRTVILCENIE